MKKKSEAGYNERLFTNGLRGKLHLARFEWLARSILRLKCEYQTIGNTDKVKRRGHKGFNYNKLVTQISDYYEVIEVSGHPLAFAPASLNFGIGIIGKSKQQKNI